MTALSGCGATFLGDRLGTRIGASIAGQVPTPPASTSAKPGGNGCEVLTALGWRSVKLGGVTGPDDALNVIGSTRETAKGCP